MSAGDPMSGSYMSYRSIDSPDIEYDVTNQQNPEFFDDFLVFDDHWDNEGQAPIVPEYQDYNPVYASATIDDHGSQSSIGTSSSHLQGNSSSSTGQAQRAKKEKIAFKTKSQVEILDDGFKWRKYGKKMVKNNPNPRY
ncbi:hypothetical protein M8C21_019041 [Ambrosia artemisiifolia]|uniref:WRKY domain-containing protein n=1 Tax=Ambrosia artemisiifolia TaxID=4212 RepID=A0AAD5BTL3_AMBAR|nr:hypothetical protein M8C21_019041 [Ambrosia artemisiifolia]